MNKGDLQTFYPMQAGGLESSFCPYNNGSNENSFVPPPIYSHSAIEGHLLEEQNIADEDAAKILAAKEAAAKIELEKAEADHKLKEAEAEKKLQEQKVVGQKIAAQQSQQMAVDNASKNKNIFIISAIIIVIIIGIILTIAIMKSRAKSA